MYRLSDFSAVHELPSLSATHRLFTAFHTGLGHVLLLSTSQQQQPAQSPPVRPDFLPEQVATFTESHQLFEVLSAESGLLNFQQVQHEVQQGRIQALAAIISLARLVQQAHQAGYILKEIKAEAIFWSAHADKALLIHCPQASTIQTVRPGLHQSTLELSSLRTLAPEATGRINCPLDQRADLYALGVLSYAILAGDFPFLQQEPLALIHAHIAKTPQPLIEQFPELDSRLTCIIDALLQKDPNARYQSIDAVLCDLRRCEQPVSAEPFVPALFSGMQTLPFPERLYEREQDVEKLIDAYQRARDNRSQLVLVRGYSGSGKTSLIEQLPPATLGHPTFFVQGKHDQYLKNRFFSALTSALGQLAEAILQEPAKALADWQQRLQQAAGDDGALLWQLVPEWKSLLASNNQPMKEPSSLAAASELARFDQLMLRLLHAISEANYSLVLFLDDVQWADRATLRWLEQLADIAPDIRLLLLISYRDHEIDDQHPLHFTLKQFQHSRIQQQQLDLKPLSSRATLQFVADTLHGSADTFEPLAELLLQKTSGNPFYLKQLMQKLYQSKLLQLQLDGSWQWDQTAIAELSISDNHASITADRLHRFPSRTQQLFQWLAILGERVSFQLLAQLAKLSPPELEQQLAEAINSGILIAYTTSDGQQLDAVRFAHDRLQQAALQLVSPDERLALHLQIALHYFSRLSANEQHSEVLTYLHHFNLALPLSLQHIAAEHLAELNLTAGRKALSSNAYFNAQRFFQQGCDLLSEHNKHPLLEELLLGLAQSAYLTQQYALAWHCCEELNSLSSDPLQHLRSCQQQILIHFARNQLTEAYELAQQQLKPLGIDIVAQPEMVALYPGVLQLYQRDTIGQLLQQQKAQDPLQLQMMEILGMLFTVAYIISPLHYMTVSYHLLTLTLKHGHSSASALGYLGHAMHLIAIFGQYSEALEFADLAVQVDAGFDKKYRAQLQFQRAAAVLPWRAPLQQSLQALEQSYHLGLQDGQLEYAAHAVLFGSFYRVLSGEPLAQVQLFGEQSIQFLTEKQFPYNLQFCQLWQQFTLSMQDTPAQATLLEGPDFSESTQLSELEQPQNKTLLFCYHCLKLMQAFIMRSGDEQQHLQAAAPLADVALALYHQTEFYFFQGLTAARYLHQQGLTADKKNQLGQQLHSAIDKLSDWANNCPSNHLHKLRLLQAEQACLTGAIDAWQLYQQAIELSQAQGFTQHTALAHELAADYWLRMQQSAYAREHTASAWLCYHHWQCHAKTQHILLDAPELAQHPMLLAAADSSADQQLDLASVLKAAETLAGEIDLQAFLLQMLQLMVENAGAQDGCLLMLSDGDKLELQASTVQPPPVLPEKLLNLVHRTKQSRLINNTSHSHLYPPANEGPKAVLCIPMVVHDQIRGVLYLQHQALTGVFRQEGIQLLQLLANQTAILFDNARLSQQLLEANRNLEQKVASRTRDLAQAKIKAEAATEAKSAFLARMSHEIRTPINAVIGLSRLASRDCRDPEQQDYLSKIRGSGEMLLSLINDILDFSKVEAGKLSLEKNRFSISPVVQQAIHMTALKAHSKGLELVADLSAEIPAELIGDPLRIQQLLVNLLNNAIKFTESGSVCLMLHGTSQAGGRYKLHGSVTDTGIGMTEQQQKRLFQSFNQADESITRKYGGSGLGLTICKQLCELMEGEIWLESEAGYGTTFYFTIELQASEYQPQQKYQALIKRQLRALVVDDMALTRMVLLKQLDELGVQAEQCSNGQDAIRRIEQAESSQHPYDFILMDWRMPGMDGIETARSIQQRLGSRSPHILMVSAYDKAQAKASMKDVKIEQFLEKPVNYSMLLDAISPLLYQQQGAAAPTAPLGSEVPNLQGKRLLLVEDHLINRQVALGFLQDTEADIDCAEHGQAALDLLQQHHYDLVLMDIQMPEMDGLTACRKIRQELKLTEVPVIAMTAHALQEDIEKSLDAGMNAHLTKPIDPDQLYQTLGRFLPGQSKTAPSGPPPEHHSPGTEPPLLDEQQARKNLGPQAAIYSNLLPIFYNEHQQLLQKMRLQLQQQDFKALQHEAHSLKAAAAYIGAFGIAALCEQLESQLRQTPPQTQALPDLLSQLEQLLALLHQRLGISNSAASQVLSNQQLRQKLQALLPMLQQSDLAAEPMLERLQQQLGQSVYAEKVAELSHTVANIEFEQACELLQALLQQLEPE